MKVVQLELDKVEFVKTSCVPFLCTYIHTSVYVVYFCLVLHLECEWDRIVCLGREIQSGSLSYPIPFPSGTPLERGNPSLRSGMESLIPLARIFPNWVTFHQLYHLALASLSTFSVSPIIFRLGYFLFGSIVANQGFSICVSKPLNGSIFIRRFI